MRYILLLLAGLCLQANAKDPLLYSYEAPPDSALLATNLQTWANAWAAKNLGSQFTFYKNSSANKVNGAAVIPYQSKVAKGRENASGTISFNFTLEYTDSNLRYDFNTFEHKGTKTPNGPAYSFWTLYADSASPYGIIEDKSFGPAWEQELWTDIQNTIDSCVASWISANGKSVKFEPLVYTATVQANNHTATELFYTALQWTTNTFSRVGNIQYADKSNGVLLLRGEIPYHSRVFLGNAGTTGKVIFTGKILVKNGKYKFEFSNFIHYGSYSYIEKIRFDPINFGALTLWNCPPRRVAFGSYGIKWECNVWQDIKNQVNSIMQTYLYQLNTDMQKATAPVEEEW